jgi:predicted Zn-dependent protease
MNLKNILKELSIKADYISLRMVKKRGLFLMVRNENFEGFTKNNDTGVMVEVLKDGQFGYAATSDLTVAGLNAAGVKALQLASKANQYNLMKFSAKERPPVTGEYISPFVNGFDDFNVKETTDLLVALSTTMKINDKIINREVGFSLNEMETTFVSTNGAEAFQKLLRSAVHLAAVASSESGTQRRSWGGGQNSQSGLEVLNPNVLKSNAKRVATEAFELLSAQDCPTGTMDLLLNPDQLFLQIHESIGHPLELDRILGDERNYAGWSFVKPKDFGTLQYGSKLMNITFDPTVVAQNASYLFDDIGSEAKKEFLIKDGLLVKGLGSLESQKRLGVGGVSSQRATSWNRPPIDRMANVNMEPGESKFEDMISSVEKGVYMMSNRSWSIDDYRNKFQFGCEFGKLIENGKITKTIKNPNYRGVTPEFWNSLKMVGDRSSWEVGGLANCGKGEPNQIMFVGHASPPCLFSNIEVFGGG